MSWADYARAAGYLLYLPLIWYAGNRFCRLVFRMATVKVGSLASLLWAVLVAGALLAYDAWIGFNFIDSVRLDTFSRAFF